MRPSTDDVQQMVSALFTVAAGLERARRRIPAAATLAVLQVIAGRHLPRPSKIAIELGLHPSSVSRHVQALVEAGHVEIIRDSADARSYFLVVTPAGQEEIRRLTQIGLQRFAKFVADWEAEEVRTLGRLLAKLEESKNAVGWPDQSQAEPRPLSRRWREAARVKRTE